MNFEEEAEGPITLRVSNKQTCKQPHDDIYATPSPSADGTPRTKTELDNRASNQVEEKMIKLNQNEEKIKKPKQGTAAVVSITHEQVD